MRLVLVALAALLIVVPIVEISVIVFVGQQIGALPTVLLLVGSALVGSWLLRREGRRAWRALREAADSGRTPATEAVEGVSVLLGGLMMMLPGFATDLFGLLLVLPPTRRVVARVVVRRFARGLPPSVAQTLVGPTRVKSTRGKAQYPPPPAGPAGTPLTAPGERPFPPAPGSGPATAPGSGRVIEGEVEN